jgi:type IV pilus assembly protein PilV
MWRFFRIGKNGFTLVEVMVALLILLVGLLMLGSMQIVTIKANAASFDITVASTLGQESIEQLKTYNVTTDPSLTAGSHDATSEAVNHPTLIPNQTINGVTYTRSYVVATNTPIAGVRTVTLTVSWRNHAMNHQVALTARIKG